MEDRPENPPASVQLEPPDAQLIACVLVGETDTYAQLVDRYSPLVRNYLAGRGLRGVELDDVAQEAFVRVFVQLNSLRKPCRFSSYLMSTASRCLVDSVRRNQRQQTAPLPAGLAAASQPAEQIPLEALQAAISQLPESMQIVLGLKYSRGHTSVEIAATLQQSVSTVTKTLSRAYARLRKNSALRRIWEEGE